MDGWMGWDGWDGMDGMDGWVSECNSVSFKIYLGLICLASISFGKHTLTTRQDNLRSSAPESRLSFASTAFMPANSGAFSS